MAYLPQIDPFSYVKPWEESDPFKIAYKNLNPGAEIYFRNFNLDSPNNWSATATEYLPDGNQKLGGRFIGNAGISKSVIPTLETTFAEQYNKLKKSYPTVDIVKSFIDKTLSPTLIQEAIQNKLTPERLISSYISPYLTAQGVTSDLITQPSTIGNGYNPSIPSELGVNSILDQLNKPTKDIVSELLMAQAPIISKEVMKGVGPAQAAAQSGFMQRGLTGSSTELGTIFKDIPEQANQAVADALAKSMIEAYPLALQEKQLQTGTTISLRKLITDEQFNTMSLQQKKELADQDAQLKLQLQAIEQQYDRDKTETTMAFTAAENEKDREFARQKLAKIEQQYADQKRNAFIKSVTTMIGSGIGAYIGFQTGGVGGMALGGALGGTGGGAVGDIASNLFQF